jgi:hypothetical protein
VDWEPLTGAHGSRREKVSFEVFGEKSRVIVESLCEEWMRGNARRASGDGDGVLS